MDYFKVNYNKLQNLEYLKLFKVILLFSIFLLIFILLSFKIYIYNTFTTVGIYQNGKLNVLVDYRFTDKIINSEYLIFNEKKVKFKDIILLEYENYNDSINQNIELVMDEKFLDNEISNVEFYYDKMCLFEYILELFKS